MFLDSDDLLAEYCLSNRVKKFELRPKNDFIVFNSWFFKSNIDEKEYLWNRKTKENDLCRFLRMDGVWPINGPIYRHFH